MCLVRGSNYSEVDSDVIVLYVDVRSLEDAVRRLHHSFFNQLAKCLVKVSLGFLRTDTSNSYEHFHTAHGVKDKAIPHERGKG